MSGCFCSKLNSADVQTSSPDCEVQRKEPHVVHLPVQTRQHGELAALAPGLAPQTSTPSATAVLGHTERCARRLSLGSKPVEARLPAS